MKLISSLRAFGGHHRYTLLLAVVTAAAWWVAGGWPWLLGKIGISDYGTPYLDSYAILAALDAYRAGSDVHAANALDPLFRGHIYSDWWLGLRWLGLTRADNFIVGTTWIAAFGLTACLTIRPKRLFEIVWMFLVLSSPAVLLALKRANNDLLIFVLLAGCALAASSPVWWRWVLAIVCLGLATGLKYFPAPVAFAFLWVRPISRMPAILLAALLTVAAAMAGIWTQIDRARFVVGSGVYTMGAPLLLRDLGWQDSVSAVPGVALILAVGLTLALMRTTTGLLKEGEAPERIRAAIGCIVLLTCFSVGVNYAYRWIFIVWPAIWVSRRSADRSLPLLQQWVARCACGLIAICLWSDGIFCFCVNVAPTVADRKLWHMQYVLRLWIQPLNWLLMFLIAGWLIEAGLSTVREWWSARVVPRPAQVHPLPGGGM